MAHRAWSRVARPIHRLKLRSALWRKFWRCFGSEAAIISARLGPGETDWQGRRNRRRRFLENIFGNDLPQNGLESIEADWLDHVMRESRIERTLDVFGHAESAKRDTSERLDAFGGFH